MCLVVLPLWDHEIVLVEVSAIFKITVCFLSESSRSTDTVEEKVNKPVILVFFPLSPPSLWRVITWISYHVSGYVLIQNSNAIPLYLHN